MQSRLDYKNVAPEVLKPLLQLEAHLNHSSGLEPSLLDLVQLPASQINGCAYCIDMHSKDLRARGETERRLDELNAWREDSFLRRSRTGGAGMDRSRYPHLPKPSTRRCVQEGTPVFQRRGTGKPDHGDRRHQRLEPPRHFFPLGSRLLPAGGSSQKNRLMTHNRTARATAVPLGNSLPSPIG